MNYGFRELDMLIRFIWVTLQSRCKAIIQCFGVEERLRPSAGEGLFQFSRISSQLISDLNDRGKLDSRGYQIR
jgi:hypothetical protein